MTCSTFCWHTEDHHFASINYVHWGAPKVWYGLPSQHAEAFDQFVKTQYSELSAQSPNGNLLADIVTMIDPRKLKAAGLPICRAIQEPGQFVVTFPRAYHAGFNVGINCAEAVNFATPFWLPFSSRVKDGRAPIVDMCDLLFRAANTLLDESTMNTEYMAQLYHDNEDSSIEKIVHMFIAQFEQLLQKGIKMEGLCLTAVRSHETPQQTRTLKTRRCEKSIRCSFCKEYAILSCLRCVSCSNVCCASAECLHSLQSHGCTLSNDEKKEVNTHTVCKKTHDIVICYVRKASQFTVMLNSLRCVNFD